MKFYLNMKKYNLPLKTKIVEKNSKRLKLEEYPELYIEKLMSTTIDQCRRFVGLPMLFEFLMTFCQNCNCHNTPLHRRNNVVG